MSSSLSLRKIRRQIETPWTAVEKARKLAPKSHFSRDL